MNTLGELERCPDCNYELKGLPGIHRCPECGFAYDKGSIVLSAKRKFRLANWLIIFPVLYVSLDAVLTLSLRRPVAMYRWVGVTLVAASSLLALWAYSRHWHRTQFLLAGPEGLSWRLRGFESVSLKWSEIDRIGLDESRKNVVVSRTAGKVDLEVPNRFIPKGKTADEISRILCEQLVLRTGQGAEQIA